MKTRSFFPAVPVLAAVLVASVVISSPKGTPDREIGLSKSSVFEVAHPEEVKPNTSEPGEASTIDPAFLGDPPVIPHGIADFIPITLKDNQCVDCHMVDTKEEGEPTPIPESHFRDLRNAPDVVREQVAGARFVCTTCHAPLTGAAALVGNGF